MLCLKCRTNALSYAQPCLVNVNFTPLKNIPCPGAMKVNFYRNCEGTTPPTRENEDKEYKEIDLDCKTLVHKT